MAWNEPGDNNDKDPWGRPKKPQGPPELDKLLKNLQKKIESALGSKPGAPDHDSKPPSFFASLSVLPIVLVVLVIWILFGIYIVRPAEDAVVLRFGKYRETVGDGPHWAPRFIDTVYKVDVQKIYPYTYTSDMLTKDENIVTVTVSVPYRVSNAKQYLFNAVNPITSLEEATASALRQVIGNTTLDDVLTSGRDVVRQNVQVQLEAILQQYQMGISVADVALQATKAPEQVKDAFDDAIKAEQDKERYVNQAKAYLEQKIATAVGIQQRILANAKAYQSQVVSNANGETARYLAMLPQYQQAPEVTRERLYMAALQEVLSKSSKIFMDSQKGNHLFLGVPAQQLFSSTDKTTQTAVIPPLLPESKDNQSTSDVTNESSAEDTADLSHYADRSTRGDS